MAPIRRYLRITKYSVLEVRIYLDKPSDAQWLLSSRDPVLPRIIHEVRPKVLPKLREENENAMKKGGKKKRGIKDVASRDEFEVTIFLTELSSRHSLLTKRKQFADKAKLRSTGNKLTGCLTNSENPIAVDDDETPLEVLREEGDDVPELSDIPEKADKGKPNASNADEDDTLFVSSHDDETFMTQQARPQRKRKRKEAQDDKSAKEGEHAQDDKKKLDLTTSYDGFSIYGRILCLVVKRKGNKKAQPAGDKPGNASQMMEQWVSTQAAQDAALNEDDDG